MINNNQAYDDILKEILPIPSEKIITDRFVSTSDSETQNCSGKCMGPGGCRA